MWFCLSLRGFSRGHSRSDWFRLGWCGWLILRRSGNRFVCHFSFRRSGLFVFGARNAFGFGFRFGFGSSATRFSIVFYRRCVFGHWSDFSNWLSNFYHRCWRRSHSGLNHCFSYRWFADSIVNLDAAAAAGLHLYCARCGFH